MARVTVIVVTWNCAGDLPICLQHLRDNTSGADWNIVLVDNASTDGTRAWIEAHAAEYGADAVLLSENRGWVASLNLAMAREASDYYFFLNPDAFVEAGWLPPLLAALESDASVGFASPKFLYPDGRIHYAGAFVGPSLSVRVTGHGEADDGRFDAPAEVPFAHGMCLARSSVFDAIGTVDEGFGLGFFEEIDYQLRARRLGFRVAYVPQSVIVHATSKAFDQHPGGYKEELLTRNWLRVMALHWPLTWLARRVPIELFRPLRALARGADARPSWRGLVGFARSLPEVVKKRRALRGDGLLHLQPLRRERL